MPHESGARGNEGEQYSFNGGSCVRETFVERSKETEWGETCESSGRIEP